MDEMSNFLFVDVVVVIINVNNLYVNCPENSFIHSTIEFLLKISFS